VKVNKATHKSLLYQLFYDQTPKGLRPKQLAIDKLIDASTAAKKLNNGSVSENGNTRFIEGQIEFSAEEWVLLKELFLEKKTGTIIESEAMIELKEIFNNNYE